MHYNISTVGLCATKATVWVYSHAVFYFDQLGRVIIVAKNEAKASSPLSLVLVNIITPPIYKFIPAIKSWISVYATSFKSGYVSRTAFTHSGPWPPTVLIKHSNSPTGTMCIPDSHKAEFSRPYAAVTSPAGSDLNPDVFKTFHFDSVLITLRISLISPPERFLFG